MILSFKKNGRKKLSKKLIVIADKIKNKIPFQIGPVKHIINPIGAQIIAAPKRGIKEANIKRTENNIAPSTLKINIKIKATNPWYKATRIYPENKPRIT